MAESVKNTLLPTEVTAADYKLGDKSVPGLSVSASKAKDSKVHLTLCNLNATAAAEVSCEIRGGNAKNVSGRILTDSDIKAHNTFAKPEAVKPVAFTGAKLSGNELKVSLPPASVVVLALE